MNQIIFIALVTFAIFIMATIIIIPVTKLMFNVAITLIPFLIVSIGAYFIYQHFMKRNKQ
ncbi:hypothetical protein FM038_012280 [Shewanella eurypsychrophilus]|uniref:Uncharacterized protein n=1 Tax=Shewanella eurypsychrophilus TaxID=2593656 RepID=A0ABX6V8F2_9GAMM|nr:MULTISPECIES: hypothetical protein [Shewanella]QFU22845.1 hypothetical protein FS418_13860 [Shewanella sp. YLB-09]QPG58132.1 hypothetical protein FM038_012280 [Shewanella eurypsychrophilus]